MTENAMADVRDRPLIGVRGTNNWKISNEQFRRLAHTGEFSPKPPDTATD